MLEAEALALDSGKVDKLVNNAAEVNEPLQAINANDFASVYDLNVQTPTLLSQATLPHLRRPGRIINISSVGARAGFANLSMYCSSKAALEMLGCGARKKWYHRVSASSLGHHDSQKAARNGRDDATTLAPL